MTTKSACALALLCLYVTAPLAAETSGFCTFARAGDAGSTRGCRVEVTLPRSFDRTDTVYVIRPDTGKGPVIIRTDPSGRCTVAGIPCLAQPAEAGTATFVDQQGSSITFPLPASE